MSLRALQSIGVSAATVAMALAAARLVQPGESKRALESDGVVTESPQALAPAPSPEAGGLWRDEDATVAMTQTAAIPDTGNVEDLEPADGRVGWPSFPEAMRVFDAELVDPVWSEASEARILSHLSLISNLGLLDVAVECRASLCRVRLLFPAGAQPIYVLRRIFAFAREMGLAPLASEQDLYAGELPVLHVVLRR